MPAAAHGLDLAANRTAARGGGVSPARTWPIRWDERGAIAVAFGEPDCDRPGNGAVERQRGSPAGAAILGPGFSTVGANQGRDVALDATIYGYDAMTLPSAS